jgi:UDP-N-acetylmuramoyl-tripeptide--D-alanyl-D-alanine ligase
MQHLHDALPAQRRGAHAADADGAAAERARVLKAGDVVMVKGSAGSRMGRVVRTLEQAAVPAPPSSKAS